MFKTTGSERENQAARQNLVDAGYTVLDGEVPGALLVACIAGPAQRGAVQRHPMSIVDELIQDGVSETAYYPTRRSKVRFK